MSRILELSSKGNAWWGVVIGVLVIAAPFLASAADQPEASAVPAGAPEVVVFDPSRIMAVPYRLAIDSGEEVELVIYFKDNYKQVDHVGYDLTQPKPDGANVYKLKANEGGAVVITLQIESNRVTSGQISAEGAGGAAPQSLTLSSRSGEQLFFTFGGATTPGAGSALVASSRMK